MSNERSKKEYWNQRVKSHRNLKTMVYSSSDFDRFEAETKRILQSFGRDATILDVGCGYGRLAELFNPVTYTGVDFSEEMIRKAKELHPNHSFMIADVNIPWSIAQFEVIFECMCLSSFEMTEEQFFEDFGPFAKVVICLEPKKFTIFYS